MPQGVPPTLAHSWIRILLTIERVFLASVFSMITWLAHPNFCIAMRFEAL